MRAGRGAAWEGVRVHDFTKSYLPFMTVISLVVFVAWSTNVVTREKIAMDSKFAEASRVTRDLAQATAELAEAIVRGQEAGWARSEMASWCQTQKLKYVELQCPEVWQSYSPVLDSKWLNKTLRKLDSMLEQEVLKGAKSDTK